MIVTTDIANILYRDCGAFEIEEVYKKGDVPSGDVLNERVVISTKEQTPGKYWKKCFVEVNLCVPDLSEDVADLARLGELERLASVLLNDVVSSHEGTPYGYSVDSTSIEADTALKCHYVNCKILFEVLNVK